jgi:hypothetical protein
MAKDRFAATNMRRRVAHEEREYARSLQSAKVRRHSKRATVPARPKQSVEEFLAGGGEITKVAGGIATEDEGSLLRRIPGTKNGFVRVKR